MTRTRTNAVESRYNYGEHMDVQPVLSRCDAYNNVGRCPTEVEPQSASYYELLRTISQREVCEDNLAKKAVRKLWVSTVGERDYFAQEVCHIFIDWDLYHCSRIWGINHP